MNKVLVLISILGSVLSSGYAIQYQVIDLGTLGGSSSSALAINNDGQIVGYASTSSSVIHAVLFDSTGGGNNIDLTPQSTKQSTAHAINNNGKIVGTSIPSSGYYYATLYDSTGLGNNITSTYYSTEARAINDGGKIVGHDFHSSSRIANIFEPNGPVLDRISLGVIGEASSVNNNGVIVGTVGTSSGSMVVLFQPTRYLIDLEHNYTSATSINDYGTIVGNAMAGFSGDSHATIFDSTGGGSNIYLGSLPNKRNSYANSINNNHQVVGYANNDEGNYQFARAVLFDSSGGGNNIDLNTLILPGSGMVLNVAFDINDNGWIVGQGFIAAQGLTHAFLLKPISDCSSADFTNDCMVEFDDFVVFAKAWLSTNETPNWNAACDIAVPLDNQINTLDLLVFAQHWFEGVQ